MHNTLLKQFISPFWSICMLQKGPQDLPTSGLLLMVVFLLGFMLDLVNLSIALPETSLLTLATLAVTYALALVLSLSGIMWLMRYQIRILPTLTALLGLRCLDCLFWDLIYGI